MTGIHTNLFFENQANSCTGGHGICYVISIIMLLMFVFSYRQNALCNATRKTEIIVIGVDITDEYWISVGATTNLRPFAKCD